MTSPEITALLDRHLEGWLGSSGDSLTLRERMAAAIAEAIAITNKDWEAGNATLRHERDALAAWRRSVLAVESSWDCQAVGKLLNLPLGSDIRANIEPGIRALLARLP